MAEVKKEAGTGTEKAEKAKSLENMTLAELMIARDSLKALGMDAPVPLEARIEELKAIQPSVELDAEKDMLIISIPLSGHDKWGESKSGNPYISLNGLYTNDEYTLNGTLVYRKNAIAKREGKTA